MIFWGINRYIMECKHLFGAGVADADTELIDTLWNVNVVPAGYADPVLGELIDTLWNVNGDCSAGLSGHFRINRYIMECKYNAMKRNHDLDKGINRYIMECKFIPTS